MKDLKPCNASTVFRSSRVFPNNFNNHFLFIALDEVGKPVKIPQVYPEMVEERYLYEKSKQRSQFRNDKRQFNKETISYFREQHGCTV